MKKSISGDTNPDAYLTNFSYALMLDDSVFIAGAASSRVPVTQEAGKYNVYPPGYFWTDEAEVRPLGGRPAQVGYGVQEDTYVAEEWALEHVIDDRTRQNSRLQGRLDENATKLLTTKQQIRADRIWATSFFKTGVWSMEVTGVAAAPGADQFLSWADDASSPLSDIEDWKELIRMGTGMEPNTLVVGANVRKRLKNHPEFVDRIKYTSSGVITNAIMAAMFEIENFRVARAVYNTAAEKATVAETVAATNLSYIVDPDAMWLGYIAPDATLDTPTAIATFAWDSLVPGQTNDFGGVISRGRDGRAYSDYFHSRQAFGMKKVSDDFAVFASDVLATA